MGDAKSTALTRAIDALRASGEELAAAEREGRFRLGLLLALLKVPDWHATWCPGRLGTPVADCDCREVLVNLACLRLEVQRAARTLLTLSRALAGRFDASGGALRGRS